MKEFKFGLFEGNPFYLNTVFVLYYFGLIVPGYKKTTCLRRLVGQFACGVICYANIEETAKMAEKLLHKYRKSNRIITAIG